MIKNAFTPLKNETVLIEAKVGKRIIGLYCLLFAVIALLGGNTLVGGIIAYVNKVDNAKAAIITGLSVLSLIIPAVFHYISARNRRYVLTDKRIVILKGGAIKHSCRSLSLKSLQGVRKDNNLVYNWFGLATIDFYAMAVASNTTKISLFSFSSTNFKFQWVDTHDADKVYELMQDYLSNGDFR